MSWLLNRLVFFSMAVIVLFPFPTRGQQIYYSPLPGVRAVSTEFEIIGKYNGKQFLYTKNYSSRQITCYSAKMKPVDTIKLEFLPYDLKDVHFIALPDGFIMVYQFVEKRDIYCKAVKFNGKGTKIKKPQLIDKTSHPFEILGDRTYSDVVSENKSRIMIYKLIKKPEEKTLTFKTFLFDSSLNLLQKGEVSVPYDYSSGPRQIRLANNGGLYFLYGTGDYSYQPYYKHISLYYKPPHENKLLSQLLLFKTSLPTAHPLLTLNEKEHTLWINTFNFDKKKRHLTSLSTYRYHMDSIKRIQGTIGQFSPELRSAFATKRSRRKAVFDHYVPRRLIFDRSGSALLIAEKLFHDTDNKTYYGTIGLFSLDEEGHIKKIQRIIKEQKQYSYSRSGSFLVMNNGRALHFLVNKSHGVTRFLNNHIYLLRDYRFLTDKTLEKMPLMPHMDKGFKWLPGLGKQTGREEAVIPCLSGGNLLFGLIVY